MTKKRNRKQKQREQLIIAGAALIAVAVIAIVVVALVKIGRDPEDAMAQKGGLSQENSDIYEPEEYVQQEDGTYINSKGKILDEEAVRVLEDGESYENVEVQVKKSSEYVEPAPGTLNIDKIQGFTSAGNSSAGNSETGTQNNSGVAESGKGSVLADSNLTVESIGSYTGNFLEDGSDEPATNVAALLVTNNSSQMLQIAQISFQVNDSETATFKVTDLPAGTSVLVLEQNRREYSDSDNYAYGDTATSYIDNPSLQSDKFDITMQDGKVQLNNKTNEDYSKVYVYYKYVQLGGAYKGGITYRTPVENIPAGGSAEAIAGHMNPDSTKIVDVQIVE